MNPEIMLNRLQFESGILDELDPILADQRHLVPLDLSEHLLMDLVLLLLLAHLVLPVFHLLQSRLVLLLVHAQRIWHQVTQQLQDVDLSMWFSNGNTGNVGLWGYLEIFIFVFFARFMGYHRLK